MKEVYYNSLRMTAYAGCRRKLPHEHEVVAGRKKMIRSRQHKDSKAVTPLSYARHGPAGDTEQLGNLIGKG